MTDLAAIVTVLLAELEAADPVFFDDMPANDEETRKLVIDAVVRFSAGLRSDGMPPATREALALATAARVVLENMTLHYRLLRATGAPEESVQAVLGRFTRKT